VDEMSSTPQHLLETRWQITIKQHRIVGAYVKLYGSSGNQFGLRGADIDMCLFVELKEDESSGSVITRLGELLEAGMESISYMLFSGVDLSKGRAWLLCISP
jgi:hypothetical protein